MYQMRHTTRDAGNKKTGDSGDDDDYYLENALSRERYTSRKSAREPIDFRSGCARGNGNPSLRPFWKKNNNNNNNNKIKSKPSVARENF
jgi:hypothetical protein